MTNEDCVRLFYRYLLGREPDPDGLKHWTAVADSETNIKIVLEGFVQSSEFATRSEQREWSDQWGWRPMGYDPRMDYLPLFISFPRTGSHWINCVMELYFGRPRLREMRTTLFDGARTDWMWFHDHDLDLTIRHPHVLYLYREPVGALFSNLVYYSKVPTSPVYSRLSDEQRSFARIGTDPLAVDEATILKFSDNYREHLRKWLLSPYKASTAVRYDRFKSESDREAEFQKICRFFDKPFDATRMAKAFATVTPEALAEHAVDPAAISSHLLTESYACGRRRFAEKWGGAIRQRVIAPELQSAFS
jgi:hypothetical protein